jgi:hypothetical protein
LRHQQGFYVYRNRRLIIWGTWFRLAKKDELSKLARVRVDIPNSLDHLWTIDVKKSAAVPPEAVRVNLRRIIERIRQASGRTLVFRGRQAKLGLASPGWREVTDRDGVRFDISRDHPVIRDFTASLTEIQQARLEMLLKVVEQSFPAEALYAHLTSDQRRKPVPDDVENSFRGMIAQIFDGWASGDQARSALLTGLHLVEPFSGNPEIARRLAQEQLQRIPR